jgi:outer membrane beta-barrel protein
MKPVFKIAAAVIISASMAVTAQAQTKKKRVRSKPKAQVEAQAEAPKKVNVENLEKRYWAPKDKKFKVVQNRSYTKTNKFFLSVMPGLMLNEEYSKGFATDVSLGYFFNDRWGMELEYQTMSLSDNDLVQQVQTIGSGSGAYANHGKATDYYGVTAKWMPFYAKMSFLGTRIVYFDLSLGLSVGNMSYEQQNRNDSNEEILSAIAYGFEISQSFYMSRKLLLRVDYKHRFYNQEVVEGGTLATQGQFIEDRPEDNISLNMGLTYIF